MNREQCQDDKVLKLANMNIKTAIITMPNDILKTYF